MIRRLTIRDGFDTMINKINELSTRIEKLQEELIEKEEERYKRELNNYAKITLKNKEK